MNNETILWILLLEPENSESGVNYNKEEAPLPSYKKFSINEINFIESETKKGKDMKSVLGDWKLDFQESKVKIQEYMKLKEQGVFLQNVLPTFIMKTYISYSLLDDSDVTDDDIQFMLTSLIFAYQKLRNERIFMAFMNIFTTNMNRSIESVCMNIELLHVLLLVPVKLTFSSFSLLLTILKLSISEKGDTSNTISMKLISTINTVYSQNTNFYFPSLYADEILNIFRNLIISLDIDGLKLFSNLCITAKDDLSEEIFTIIVDQLAKLVDRTRFGVSWKKRNSRIVIDSHDDIGMRRISFVPMNFDFSGCKLLPPMNLSLLLPENLQKVLTEMPNIIRKSKVFESIFTEKFKAKTGNLENEYKRVAVCVFISMLYENDGDNSYGFDKIVSNECVFDASYSVIDEDNKWLNTLREIVFLHISSRQESVCLLLEKLLVYPLLFSETMLRCAQHSEVVNCDDNLLQLLTRGLILYQRRNLQDALIHLLFTVYVFFDNNETATIIFNNQKFISAFIPLFVCSKDMQAEIMKKYKLFLDKKGKIEVDQFTSTIFSLFMEFACPIYNELYANLSSLLLDFVIETHKYYDDCAKSKMFYDSVILTLETLDKTGDFREYVQRVIVFLRISNSFFPLDKKTRVILEQTIRIEFKDFTPLIVPLLSLMKGDVTYETGTSFTIQCPEAITLYFNLFGEKSIDFLLSLCTNSRENILSCSKAALEVEIVKSIKEGKLKNEKAYQLLTMIYSEHTTVRSFYSIVSLLETKDKESFSLASQTIASIIRSNKKFPDTYVPIDGRRTIKFTQHIKDGFTFMTWMKLEYCNEKCAIASVLKVKDQSNNFVEVFFSNYVPSISLLEDTKSGTPATNHQMQPNEWFSIEVTYVQDKENVYVALSINGQPESCQIEAHDNFCTGECEFVVGDLYNSSDHIAALGPILLFKPLQEDEVFAICQDGVDVQKSVANDALYAFIDNNLYESKPDLFLAIIDKYIDSCIFLPMFLSANAIDSESCLNQAFEILTEFLVSRPSAEESFNQKNGFTVLLRIVLSFKTHLISYQLYMQFVNLAHSLKTDASRSSLLTEIILNMNVWCKTSLQEQVKILNHWLRSLIPSFHPLLNICITIKMLTSQLVIFNLLNPIKEGKDYKAGIDIFIQLISSFTRASSSFDNFSMVTSLLNWNEGKKMHLQLVNLIHKLVKANQELINDERFFPYVRSILCNDSDDVRLAATVILFDETFSSKIPPQQLNACLAKVCSKPITNGIFSQIMASSISSKHDTLWACCYIIYNSPDGYQYARSLFSGSNIVKTFDKPEELVWICALLFSPDKRLSELVMPRLCNDSLCQNWPCILECIGIAGSVFGVDPEDAMSAFVYDIAKSVSEKPVNERNQYIGKLGEIVNRQIYGKTPWPISSSPRNVEDIISNIINFPHLDTTSDIKIKNGEWCDIKTYEIMHDIDENFVGKTTETVSDFNMETPVLNHNVEEIRKHFVGLEQTLRHDKEVFKKYPLRTWFHKMKTTNCQSFFESPRKERDWIVKLTALTQEGTPFGHFKVGVTKNQFDFVQSHAFVRIKMDEFIGECKVAITGHELPCKLYKNKNAIGITQNGSTFHIFFLPMLYYAYDAKYFELLFNGGISLNLVFEDSVKSLFIEKLSPIEVKDMGRIVNNMVFQWQNWIISNYSLLFNLSRNAGMLMKVVLNKSMELTKIANDVPIKDVYEAMIRTETDEANAIIPSLLNESHMFKVILPEKQPAPPSIEPFTLHYESCGNDQVKFAGVEAVTMTTTKGSYEINIKEKVIFSVSVLPKKTFTCSFGKSCIDFLFDGETISSIPLYFSSVTHTMCDMNGKCIAVLGSEEHVHLISPSSFILSFPVQGMPKLLTLTPTMHFICVITELIQDRMLINKLSVYSLEGQFIKSLFINKKMYFMSSFTNRKGNECIAVVDDTNTVYICDAYSLIFKRLDSVDSQVNGFHYVRSFNCCIISSIKGEISFIDLDLEL